MSESLPGRSESLPDRPESLPDRPDLDQLRRRAKELRDGARRGDAAALERLARSHPGAPDGPVRLAAAQLVIARELGFSSWPRLVAAVETDTSSRRSVSALLDASIHGRVQQAARVLRGDLGIAARSLPAASMLGDAEAVQAHLAADPGAATAIDDERGWPPLLYACYSPWHRIDPARAAGLAEVVRLLLAAGANPNTNDGGRPRYRSALKGAVETDNPAVAELLLAAGAHPDPGQPIAEAVGHRDHRCLRLLISHGARIARTWALGAAIFHDDAEAASLLLDALAARGDDTAEAASRELPDAAADVSAPLVRVLLRAGADPRAADSDGVSALRRAVRAGKTENAALLRQAGAVDDSTLIDRFLGACLDADREAVESLLAEDPHVYDRLSDDERAVICDAAATRPGETLALMLELGFSPRARRYGDLPLHNAAYHGNASAVRVLLNAGAEVDAHDTRFDATPLAFATVGSGERAGWPGDWITTVRLLLDAGAARRDVWVTDKPPSEEVAELLQTYGITPPEPAEQAAADGSQDAESDADSVDGEVPDSLGTGVLADIARHLATASRERDLDLLGSLLHPEVRWTGLCTNRTQVLDWFRSTLAEVNTVEVRSVEVDDDAVVLGLSVTRHAEGARPAPPQQVYQVYTVMDDQIIEIRGYSSRDGALSRRATGAS